MDFKLDNYEIQQEAEKFLYSLECAPIESINVQIDDKKHRFQIAGDKGGEKSGEYLFHSDGWPAGYVRSYRTAMCYKWKYEPKGIENDKEYKAAVQKALKQSLATRAKREEEFRLEQEAKSKEAKNLFYSLKQTNPDNIETLHSYPKKKKINAQLLRMDDNYNLLVPIRDIDGHFMTVQFIDMNGNKKFYPGAPVQEGFFYANAVRDENSASNIFSEDIFDNDSIPMLICEGVATAKSLLQITNNKYPVLAAMNCHNIIKVAEKCRAKFPKRKIYIMADNDRKTERERGTNPGIDAAKKAVESGFADAYIFPKFPVLPDMDAEQSLWDYLRYIGAESEEQETLWRNGTDWNDYLLANGMKKSQNEIREQFAFINSTDIERAAIEKTYSFNAADLMKEKLPPLKWAVEGLLPEGLTILAGSPKIGKSFIALNMALAIAVGGITLGKIDVTKGAVLYLALEDDKRRLQDRIRNFNFNIDDDISSLTFVTQIPKQHEGGLAYIEWWLRTHPNARLCIIDTWSIFHKPPKVKQNIYDEDYSIAQEIKKLADKYHVAIMVIHHLKKGSSEDWTQEISGSTGLTGAADCILAIKHERNNKNAVLHRTGRDVEEKDFGLISENMNWILTDAVEAVTMNSTEQKIYNFIKEQGRACSPKEISDETNININSVRSELRRMLTKNIIKQDGRGQYLIEQQ